MNIQKYIIKNIHNLKKDEDGAINNKLTGEHELTVIWPREVNDRK